MTSKPSALEGRRVLYISYNGMLDPLGQSQVLPYLRELASQGVRFTLLSFERPNAFEADGAVRCRELRASLATENIEWHWLRYHQRPSLPATVFDVIAGTRYAARLVKRNRIELVHARAQIAATIALRLKQRFGIKFIFDVRGLMAEEYVDAGHWRKNSVPYRLTKTMESRALEAADGVVTLTERIWPVIREWKGIRGRPVVHEVIPCCTNLELFKFSPEDRARRREELNVSDRFVVVYSGSIDGWYLTEQMVDFFVSLARTRPEAYLLWLTPSRHERIRELMRSKGVSERDYAVIAASTQNVPSYLSAADAGLAFIKPCFSKLASSPTKYAEYLACGLPLIINAGIGDSDFLVTIENAGVLVTDFTDEEFARAAEIVDSLHGELGETRERARQIAERYFDVRQTGAERYTRLYERVFSS
ncbi:MAG TPA: glycosyltransferase family 4 protein [Pyrinomonadaceae bacterium]|nr:glycosyltransferase family 4 protein [Pyrinomonadaceae bacterium]